MVKNILSNLSRGFFYTFGRVIAFFVIGFIIYYLISKFGGSIESTPIIRGLY